MSDENRALRYLKYAIGEIILVVLGILIALQINDANDRRKTENVKQNYYKQIVVDLDKETVNLEERIVFLDSCITSFNEYASFIQTPNLEAIQIVGALSKVELSFRYMSFNTNTIQTLISTGDIKLIPEDIRNRLAELKRSQDQTSRVAKGNYEIYLNSQQKAAQLGFFRLAYQFPATKDLKIEERKAEMVLTLEGGLMLKDYTDKMFREMLADMLIDIQEIKDLIALELDYIE